MSAKNPKAGRGPCPTCGETVLFRKSSVGRLTYSCDHCDTSGYSEPNGKGHRKWEAGLAPIADDTPPEPGKPAPAAKSSGLNLGAL